MITKQFAYRKETHPVILKINSHCAGWLFTDETGERLFVAWAATRNEDHLTKIILELKAKEEDLEVVDLDTAGLEYTDSTTNGRKGQRHGSQEAKGGV